MEKLVFRDLESESEINAVLEKVENFSGVRLPFTYAANSRIVGVFLQDQLAASYILVTKPSFRSIAFVPDAIKKSNPFFGKDEYDFMEVNGLWIGPALRTPSQQVRVWFQLIKDIFYSKKQYVLLMRDLRTRSMERFLNMANPVEVYTGPPFLSADSSTHERIQVSYTTRWKIVLNSHKYLLELRNRHKRAVEFGRRRENSTAIKHTSVELAGS